MIAVKINIDDKEEITNVETFEFPSIDIVKEDSILIDHINKENININTKTEIKIGKILAEHYNIKGFPTIVIIDKDSMEVDRIIGYLPPDEFHKELQRIQNGDGTILDLIDRAEQTPNNFDLWLELAGKYEDRGDLEAARDVYLSVADAGIGDQSFVYFKLVELNSFIDEDVTDLEYYIAENLNSEYAQYAFQSVISIMRKNKDIEGEADAWRRYINLLELNKSYTASIYNSFAWRMTELEMNLEKALEKIRVAINLTKSSDKERIAGYKDTEAEVLWKMGRIEETVNIIDEAIELQPDDEYFKKQREKFLDQ